MATANAATFDGTNDYLSLGTDLTGNADDDQVLGFLAFKRGATGQAYMYQNGGERFAIRFSPANVLIVEGKDTSNTKIRSVNGSSLSDTSSWHTLLFSMSATALHFYVDDVSDIQSSTNDPGDIEFTRPAHGIWALANGGAKFTGDGSIVWLGFGKFLDLSVEANRRIFVTSDNKISAALAASADGDVGGLGQPIIFLNSAVPDYENNLGTGGGFTENGTLVAATGPEIGPNIPLLRRRREPVYAF